MCHLNLTNLCQFLCHLIYQLQESYIFFKFSIRICHFLLAIQSILLLYILWSIINKQKFGFVISSWWIIAFIIIWWLSFCLKDIYSAIVIIAAVFAYYTSFYPLLSTFLNPSVLGMYFENSISKFSIFPPWTWQLSFD